MYKDDGLKQEVARLITEDFLINEVFTEVKDLKKLSTPYQYLGLCPVHDDQNRSFSVCADPSNPSANCKACGAEYGYIGYLQNVKGISSSEVYFWLADRLGISYKRRNVRPKGLDPIKFDKYHSHLINNPEYLAVMLRKTSREVIDQFKIGIDFEGRAYTDSNTGRDRIHGKGNYIIPMKNNGIYEDAVSWSIGKRNTGLPYIPGFSSAKIYPMQSLQSKVVYIMEGESDLLKALEMGLPAVTNSFGVNTWKDEWSQLFKGKDVRLVLDIDEAGRRGASKRITSLVGKVAKLRNVVLPLNIEKHPKGDFCDYVKETNVTKDEFVAFCDACEVLDNTPETKVELGDDAEDIAIAQYIQNQQKYVFIPEIGGEGQVERSGFYQYQDKGSDEGVWSEMPTKHIESHVLDLLGKMGVKQTTRKINEIVRLLEIIAIPEDKRYKYNDDRSFAVLNNGVYHFGSKELKEFSRDYKTTIKRSINYNPDATCPLWEKSVADWTEGDEDRIRLLQEVFGYCMTDIKMNGESFFFYGEGSDGKSQIAKVLEELINRRNCSFQSFHDLSNTFNLVLIKDKLCNIGSEISSTAYAHTEIFKKASTGDTISAAEKFKNAITFTPFCKFVFFGNHLPKVSDTSHGWARRITIFPFFKQFKGKERNNNLTEGKKLLLNELDGIFNWAMEGYDRLIDNGEFSKSDKVEFATKDYLESQNIVEMFIKEKCDFNDNYVVGQSDGDEHRVVVDDFCSAFREWAKDQGYKSGSARTSSTWSNRAIGKEVKRITGKASSPSNGSRYYMGISLKEDPLSAYEAKDRYEVDL